MTHPLALQLPRRPQPRQFSARCVIEVKGLRVLADIGVYPHEMLNRQPLDLDVELVLSDAPQADALSETVDYARVVALAKDLGAKRTALIEIFSRRLAESLLEHPLVESASVHVSKPHALPGCTAGCRVQLARLS